MTVHIGLDLPPEQYRALAKIATARGINAHTLIEQLVTHALMPKAKPDRAMSRLKFEARRSEIRRLHATGMKDWQIGELVGLSPSGVAFHRQKMLLPANDIRGRKKITPNQIESTAA
jgi:DNA-binding NarL/FixJ family response regulator